MKYKDTLTLNDYVSAKILSNTQYHAIITAVDCDENILICGETCSGKSTLAAAIIDYKAKSKPGAGIVIIEEIPELQKSAPSSRPHNPREHDVHSLSAAAITLNGDSDFIVVGDVYNAAQATVICLAWAIGRQGLAVIHGKSPQDAVLRLEQLRFESDPEAFPAFKGLLIQACGNPSAFERSFSIFNATSTAPGELLLSTRI